MSMVYTAHVHNVNMTDVNILCDDWPMENMGSRLRAARIAAGFKSARSAAIRFGWSPSTYAAHENGQNEFDAETAAKYARAFDTSAGYLLTGESAPETDERRVESSVDADIGRRKDDAAILEADVRTGAGGGGVPAGVFHVSDGHGNTYQAEGIRDQWIIPQTVVREMLHASPAHIRIFEVIGDSMINPDSRAFSLYPGDRVFADLRDTKPSPEGIFVLWDGLSVVVKRVEVVRGADPIRLRLISANPQYSPYEATLDEVRIIGRYVGRFTVF
jgi:phage repressor protein C with HTH and peptisase S24 domain